MLAVELEGCHSSTTRTTAPDTSQRLVSKARIRKLYVTSDDEECVTQTVCGLLDMDYAASVNIALWFDSMVVILHT